MTSTQKPTSYVNLFSDRSDALSIKAIEIPLIQRDYAQGRTNPEVSRIRSGFVSAIWGALRPGANHSLELDFIYGDVDEDKFVPLDGQQRLTLLFLLHCYVAWQADELPAKYEWSKFSYATRAGARAFCEFLSRAIPDISKTPSDWIKDLPQYLPTWDYDPTIQSMLVVLDALHEQKPLDIEWSAAWCRLVDRENPAIRFHLLSMKANGLTDSHYIKMNSRGKPLTTFENFKARLEQSLSWPTEDKKMEIASAIDGKWSDTLWKLRQRPKHGGSERLLAIAGRKIVDDGFLRYFRFIAEVCAWKSNLSFPEKSKDDQLTYLCELAETVFGKEAKDKESHLDFMQKAFDLWSGIDTDNEFSELFTIEHEYDPKKLRLWKGLPDAVGVNFFKACCLFYGEGKWDYAHTLLFYAVIQGRIVQEGRPEKDTLLRRLRTVRNLVEASRDGEIREANMPGLLADVAEFIESGCLSEDVSFNKAQVEEEKIKANLLQSLSHLKEAIFKLEDHEFLQGGLSAFDLNPESLATTSSAFLKALPEPFISGSVRWSEFGAALLTFGDYSRWWNRNTGYYGRDLGSPERLRAWQTLFRGKAQGNFRTQLKGPLADLLKEISGGATIEGLIQKFPGLSGRQYDWRYYLVKYDVMRSSISGRYMFSQDGYSVCMLHHAESMNSYYADPFLWAVVNEASLGGDYLAMDRWPHAFSGYESHERWLSLKNGIGICSVREGWKVQGISEDIKKSANWQQATQVLNRNNVRLAVSPDGKSGLIHTLTEPADFSESSGGESPQLDAVDRIQVAALWLKAMLDAVM